MRNESARKMIFHFAWSLLFLLMLINWLGIVINGILEFIPFLISMIVLGLPHGATDHLIPFRLKKQPVTARFMSLVITAYVATAALYGWIWAIKPAAGVIIFILLTWFHWGQGELYAVQKFIGVQKRGIWRKGLTILVRGALPMLVPLFAFPDVYLSFVKEMITVIDPNTQDLFMKQSTIESWRLSLLLLFGMVITSYVIDSAVEAAQQQTWLTWLVDSIEIGLLILYFYTVPPILAIGVYFCVWHSVRHIIRIMLTDTSMRNYLRNDRLWLAYRKFAHDSAPLTAVSLLVLGGGYLLIIDGGISLPYLMASYLILISMLTLPHTLIVCWMDHSEQVWLPQPE